MKKFWNALISLEVGLVLLGLVCAAMAGGSFGLEGELAEALNSIPLFAWLVEFPVRNTWWLWLTVTFLVLLVVNTVCCSGDTIVNRFRHSLLAWLPAQLVHLGFLLIVLAHLQSSVFGFKGKVEIPEGAGFQMPDGVFVEVARVGAIFSPDGSGMPLGYKAMLVSNSTGPAGVTISPNNPWFSNGFGVYIKHAEPGEPPVAFLEVHREPGARIALAGAIVFVVGNVMLLIRRSRKGED